MTYTLQQFGQQVKKKFPQLASKRDEEAAQMVLQKYPEYQSWVQEASTLGTQASDNPQMINPQLGATNADNFQQSSAFGETGGIPQVASTGFQQSNAFGGTSPQPKRSLLGRIGSFLGQATGVSGIKRALNAPNVAQGQQNAVVDIGNQASQLIAQARQLPVGDPQRRMLLQQAQALTSGGVALADKSLADVPTNLQGLASVGKLGLTIGSMGLGTPATVAGRLGQATLSGTALGGLDVAEKGGTGKEILKGAGIGAISGLASGGLMEGVRWASQNLPKRLMASASGLTNKQMGTKKGQEALQYALEKNKVGTQASLIKGAEKEIQTLGEKIQQTIISAGDPKINLKNVFSDIVKKYPNAGLDPATLAETIANAVPGERLLISSLKSQPASTINALRSAVGKALGDRGFQNSANSFTKDIIKDFYFSLGDYVDDAVRVNGERVVKNLISDQGKEITLKLALQSAAAKAGNNRFISLSDLIAAGVGSAGAGLPGGLVGAAALRAIESTPAKTGGALLIKKIAPILLKLSPQEQQVITQAILNYANKSKKQ